MTNMVIRETKIERKAMEVSIVKAEKNDLEAILKLQKECYVIEAEIYNDYNIAPLTQDIQSLEEEFEKSAVLKAVIENKIIGSARGFVENETLYIGRLIVDKNYQNKGIGQKLLDAMEQHFKKYARIELFTGSKSEKNLYLYNKKGYKEFKRQKINDNLSLVFLEKIIIGKNVKPAGA